MRANLNFGIVSALALLPLPAGAADGDHGHGHAQWHGAAPRYRSEPAIVIEFPARRTRRDRALVVLSDDGWQDWPAYEGGRTDLTF